MNKLNKEYLEEVLDECMCEGEWYYEDEVWEAIKNELFEPNKRFQIYSEFPETIVDLKEKEFIPIYYYKCQEVVRYFDFLEFDGDERSDTFYDKDYIEDYGEDGIEGAVFTLEYSLDAFLNHMNTNRAEC